MAKGEFEEFEGAVFRNSKEEIGSLGLRPNGLSGSDAESRTAFEIKFERGQPVTTFTVGGHSRGGVLLDGPDGPTGPDFPPRPGQLVIVDANGRDAIQLRTSDPETGAATGGQLTLLDSAGSAVLSIIGEDGAIVVGTRSRPGAFDAKTGSLLLRGLDGERSVVLEGEGARLRVGGESTGGKLSVGGGDGGRVTVESGGRHFEVIELDGGRATIGAGTNGVPGRICARDSGGKDTVILSGDDHLLKITAKDGGSWVELDGDAESANVGAAGHPGKVSVRNQNGVETLQFDGEARRIHVGGDERGGIIGVKNDGGEVTVTIDGGDCALLLSTQQKEQCITLDGALATATIGGKTIAGKLDVTGLGRTPTVEVRGDSAVVRLKRGNMDNVVLDGANATFELGSPPGEVSGDRRGGMLKVRAGSGASAFQVKTGVLFGGLQELGLRGVEVSVGGSKEEGALGGRFFVFDGSGRQVFEVDSRKGTVRVGGQARAGLPNDEVTAGQLILHNKKLREAITLDARSATITAGTEGTGAKLTIRDEKNREALRFDTTAETVSDLVLGGAGQKPTGMSVKTGNNVAALGFTTLLGTSFQLRGTDDVELLTVSQVFGEPTVAEMTVGGARPKTGAPSGRSGRIRLRDTAGTERIGIDAGTGKLTMFDGGHKEVLVIDGADGDIRLVGADCAEEFELAADDEDAATPGTLLVVDDEGRLRVSRAEYDTKAVGVVSGAGGLRPGITLDNRGGASRAPIALVGKVYCKADADFGAIATGDLLTSSGTTGHAMKAADPARAFGAVIGKALGPLTEGRGLIPVLIALQ